MNPNHKDPTDLKRIKGIGKSREKWLKEVLHIETLLDLSQINAEAIEAHIRAEGLIVSSDDINRWIEQAQTLASSDATAESSQASMRENEPQWQPYASFVIEYQARTLATGEKAYRTTAHFMEADRGTSWPGTVTTEIADWLRSQTSMNSDLTFDQQEEDATIVLSEPQPEEAREAQERADETPDDAIIITQVKAYQPIASMLLAGSGKSGQPFLGKIRSEEPFALEVAFEFADLASSRLITGAPFLAQCYAFNKATGATTLLGDIKIDQLEHNSTQKALLPWAQLASGLYRFRIHTTVQSTPPRKSYLEVPFVQVS